MGGGYWRNEGALAFGAGYTSENGRVRANLSGATTGGSVGVGAGISVTLRRLTKCYGKCLWQY